MVEFVPITRFSAKELRAESRDGDYLRKFNMTALVPLLLAGVRHHPPGRTDKKTFSDVSVPRLAGFSLLTCSSSSKYYYYSLLAS